MLTEITDHEVLLINKEKGMDLLKQIFPTGKADFMNFCIFSTSGVHGYYSVIEEMNFKGGPRTNQHDSNFDLLTVQIIQPRLVKFYYGTIEVRRRDIEWLKVLRQTSWDVMHNLGREI